jgi:hypothetical protein
MKRNETDKNMILNAGLTAEGNFVGLASFLTSALFGDCTHSDSSKPKLEL